MSESRKVIAYIGDNSDVLQKIKAIEHAQDSMTKGFGEKFGQVARVIGDDLQKIKTIEPFKKIIDPKTKEVIGTVNKEIQSVVQNVELTNGQFGKLTTTTEFLNGQLDKSSYQFQEVAKGMTEAEKSQAALLGKSSKLGTNLGNVTDINQKFAHELQTVGKATTLVGDNFTKISGDTKVLGTVVKTADGKFLKLQETITRTPEGLQKVSRSVQDVSKSYEQNSKHTKTLGDNLSFILKRAALTIPVWLVLRSVVTGTLKAFGDSAKNLVEFDKALQKLKKNLQGTPEQIKANFDSAQQAITQFSIKSGKSTEDITKAIQRFATVGFDFATSMKAGIEATKLATVLFGEAEETANAFARGLRALATDVNDTAKTQEEISSALGLTSKLWEVNAFEIGELNQGLEKFAGTAKTMNFTIEETLTLLAALSTRGLNAERAGTLLRTSTQKLEQNLSKVAKVLGVQVNPEVDRTFDVFVRVTNAIAKLKNEAGTVSPAVSEAIGELFGGVRGGEPIRDLIADIGGINEAFQKFSKNKVGPQDLNKEFARMNDTVFRQVEIMHNLNKETGKAFLVGLTGAKDLVGSLKAINNVLLGMQKSAGTFGTALRLTLTNLFPTIKLQLDATRFKDESVSLLNEINEGLQGQLADIDLRKLIVKVGGLSLKKVPQSLRNALGLQLQEQLQDGFEQSPVEVQPIVEAKNIRLESKRQKSAEEVLKSELEVLKSRGASTAELLKAETIYTKMLGLSREDEQILERKLATERAINEEKRLQSRLGSESIKLFEIAQTQGVDIAKKIGDVLAGEVDFSSFVRRGGEAVEVFKKEFADVFKQQQATAFFQGRRVPGSTGLRGGFGVNIQESAIRGEDRSNLTRIAAREGLLPKAGVTEAERLQKLYVANMNVDLIDFSRSALKGENLLTNALFQSRSSTIPPGTITNAELKKVQPLEQNRFEINFASGAFVIHGTPDQATRDAIKNSVTSAIQDFQNKIIGKQTNVL